MPCVSIGISASESNANVTQLEELTGLLAAEVDREALQMFVETYGSSCASYGG